VAWVPGGRDTATFRRLYKKVSHLKDCTFYTDGWDVFSKVPPANRHEIGKAHTIDIERDNSNTRHYLGRFTRRTKVVSRTKRVVDLTSRSWRSITTTNMFSQSLDIALSIYK
jgi:insertion element IS1 protein InsB